MRIHLSWYLPFDKKTATELGIAIFELARYCDKIEGDSEGVVLECLDLAKDVISELEKQLKNIKIEVEELEMEE